MFTRLYGKENAESQLTRSLYVLCKTRHAHYVAELNHISFLLSQGGADLPEVLGHGLLVSSLVSRDGGNHKTLFMIRPHQAEVNIYKITLEMHKILVGSAFAKGLAKDFDALQNTPTSFWRAGPVGHSPDHFQALRLFQG